MSAKVKPTSRGFKLRDICAADPQMWSGDYDQELFADREAFHFNVEYLSQVGQDENRNGRTFFVGSHDKRLIDTCFPRKVDDGALMSRLVVRNDKANKRVFMKRHPSQRA